MSGKGVVIYQEADIDLAWSSGSYNPEFQGDREELEQKLLNTLASRLLREGYIQVTDVPDIHLIGRHRLDLRINVIRPGATRMTVTT